MRPRPGTIEYQPWGLLMPVHDWNRVDAGIFHDFHNAWITELRNTLNGGLLPSGYYALGEQHAGRYLSDILTLHATPGDEPPPLPPPSGGLLVAEAPPRARRRLSAPDTLRRRRRTVAIRHVTGHRLIALIEIVSPANQDRADHVADFVRKAVDALDTGIHLLLVDILRPGRSDPQGMHGAIWSAINDEPYDPPADEPFTLASYIADTPPVAYLEHLALGGTLSEMPLFLARDRYVNLPLETSYQAAFRGVPEFWRDMLSATNEPPR